MTRCAAFEVCLWPPGDKWRGLKKRQRASAEGRGRARAEGEDGVGQEHILDEEENEQEEPGNAGQERVEVEPNEEEIAMVRL